MRPVHGTGPTEPAIDAMSYGFARSDSLVKIMWSAGFEPAILVVLKKVIL